MKTAYVVGAVLSAVLAAVAGAAPHKSKPKTDKPVPKVEKTEKAEDKPDKRAKPPPGVALDAAASLQQLRTLYDALEYDQVSALCEQLLAREDLTTDQRLEAWRLQGSAKAIIEDPVDAEKPFRLLLRSRVDYELPENTPPKILAVFRKVQSEERALASQLQVVQRDRTIANLKLLGEPPTRAQGGLPLKFSFRLRDPTGAVDSVRVPYRRAGQKDFSMLALSLAESGEWKGAIPGDVTADDKGFKLEFYVETIDGQGPLLTMGGPAAPKLVEVAAGQVPRERFTPVPKGLFWTSVGVTAALGVAAGALGISLSSTQKAYTTLVSGSGPLDGSLVNARAKQGETLAVYTNAGWISALSMLAVTLLLIPFTDFGAE